MAFIYILLVPKLLSEIIDRDAYLGCWNSPNLKVIRTHENLIQTISNIPNVPLVKVTRLVRGGTRAGLESSINKTVQALHLLVFGQQGDVVLEGIGDPTVLVADVGDTLVLIPVGGTRQGFIEAIVEVLVVREDDMTTDIEEL